MNARAKALHDRMWAARARLSVDHSAGRPVDQDNVTDALLSCGCTMCRSQTRQIAVELHRAGALDEAISDRAAWLEIPEFPAHQVRADGSRVRSVDRIVRGRLVRGRELKLFDPQPADDSTAARVRAGGGGPRCSIATAGGRRATLYPLRFVRSLNQQPREGVSS